MYFLTGATDCIRTLVAVTSGYRSDSAAEPTLALKEAYRRYLAAEQPGVPIGEGLHPHFSSYSTGDSGLLEVFQFDEPPTSAESEGQALPPAWDLGLIREAYGELRSLCPELMTLFDLVVNVVYSPSDRSRPGSGTMPRGIGAMYVNPLPTWTPGDVMETLIHELTHTLLFIDEYRYQHYLDYGALFAENLSRTAILNEEKPLTVVFHSIVVAAEVASLRGILRAAGISSAVHGESADLYRSALASCDALYGMPKLGELAAPRLLELVEKAQARLQERSSMEPRTSMAIG